MISFQGISLRHSKYWRHSLNDCSARRLYIQWLVFWCNHSIWRQWRRLNNVQWLSIVYVQAWLPSTRWNSCKWGLVYKWHAHFSYGRENIADDDRDGRPKTIERVRSGIEEALNEDERKTIYELADHVDVSHRTFYYIITNKLKMAKVSACYVPRLLSEQDKSVNMTFVTLLL